MSNSFEPIAVALDFRTAGNDVIVHDPARERVHVLNTTAAYILQSCDGTRTAATIADEVSASTGVPAERTLPDVERALAEFRALHLIR